MSGPADIGRLRLAAQRVVGPPAVDAVEVVRCLTAVQAQDYGGALTSVALRSAARSRDEAERALDAGAIVRTVAANANRPAIRAPSTGSGRSARVERAVVAGPLNPGASPQPLAAL